MNVIANFIHYFILWTLILHFKDTSWQAADTKYEV